MEGQTSCPGLPPDSPLLGEQAANWDSMVILELEPPVMKEVSMGIAKSHQRTEMRMGLTCIDTHLHLQNIQTFTQICDEKGKKIIN